LVFAGAIRSVAADVITDWNQKAVPIVTAYSLSAPAYRDMALMHIAMFDCVNAIEPRYQPYKAKFESTRLHRRMRRRRSQRPESSPDCIRIPHRRSSLNSSNISPEFRMGRRSPLELRWEKK